MQPPLYKCKDYIPGLSLVSTAAAEMFKDVLKIMTEIAESFYTVKRVLMP